MVLGHFFFLVINATSLKEALSNLPVVSLNALPLDLSVVAAILAIPALWSLVVGRIDTSMGTMKVYSMAIGALVALVLVLDPFFYRYWGMKVNLLFLQYLDDPNSGFRSVAYLDYLKAAAMLACLYLLHRLMYKNYGVLQTKRWISLLILPLLFVVIRGGIGRTPLNISVAYFSSESMLNQAAINPVWNLVAYEMDRKKFERPDLVEDSIKAEFLEFLTKEKEMILEPIPLNDSSRVVLIILESFTAKMSSYMGEASVSAMPELDEIAADGICFANTYASSFRSDRGLTSILMALPSLSGQSLTNLPTVLEQYPNLINIYRDLGWHTSFMYGGDVNFSNLRILLGGADVLVDLSSLSSDFRSVWGVHDEVMFPMFLDQILTSPKPALNVFFTLSSHEPYIIPHFDRFAEPYANSIAYTDSCLGRFVENLKLIGEWDNTLLVITADHGSSRPGNEEGSSDIHYKIPLILSGGLVKTDTMVTAITSQMDIAPTLAEFVGAKDSFMFGHSLIRPWGMAFYNYYNGVVSVTDTCVQYYDITQGRYLGGACQPPYEKAYFELANDLIFRF